MFDGEAEHHSSANSIKLDCKLCFTPQCLDDFNVKLDQHPLGHCCNPNWWVATQDDTVVEMASFITLCVSTVVIVNLVDVVMFSGSNGLIKDKC